MSWFDNRFEKVFGGAKDILGGGGTVTKKTKRGKTLKQINDEKYDISSAREDIIKRNLSQQSSSGMTGAGFIQSQKTGFHDLAGGDIENISRDRRSKNEKKKGYKKSTNPSNFLASMEDLINESKAAKKKKVDTKTVSQKSVSDDLDRELAEIDRDKKRFYDDEEEEEVLGIVGGLGFGNAFAGQFG